jgi:uncharacterized membrane protein
MEFTRNNRYVFVIFFAILFFAIALRLVNITDGLWLDEIWSMVMSAPEKSTMDIINACKTDTHPPLFDLLLHYYLVVFGDNPINGRILSLLIAFMGIFATLYYTLRISKSTMAAMLAFGLISLNFFHIYYSVEGRFYTFIYLLSLSIICRIYLYYKEKKSIHLILFTLFSILIVYTHYYGAILLMAIGMVMLFLVIKKKISIKEFMYSVLVGLIVLLAFAPWLPYMFSGQEKESWMTVPSIGSFFEYLYNYSGKNPIEFLFVLVALIFSYKYWQKNVLLYALLYGTIILGFLIPWIISSIKIPMLHIRYTFIYLPSIILMVSLFWDQTTWLKMQGKRIVFSLVIISILINFFFINEYTKGLHKEPWKAISEDLARENHKDLNPIYSEVGFYLDYYLEINKHPQSKAIQQVIEGNSFYYLHSPYDENRLEVDGYEVISQMDYGKGFVLYRYRFLE